MSIVEVDRLTWSPRATDMEEIIPLNGAIKFVAANSVRALSRLALA